MNKIPKFGSTLAHHLQKTKDSLRYLLVESSIFEELGFTYFGPIDGHNITEMTEVLSHAKMLKGPVLIHVITKKGKGYAFAEDKPHKFHGIGAFDVSTGLQNGHRTHYASSSTFFGKKLVEIAKSNPSVVAITAAMPDGTGLTDFSAEFKNRFFDVGIAEQHAVTFAAGLAKEGMTPVVAIYSTFLQRAYDQIFHDVALQKLHVVFSIDRSGIVGEDGETHHGIYDLSYLSHIPGICILAPSDGVQLCEMLDYAVNRHSGPIAIRYHKFMTDRLTDSSFEFGRADVVRKGSDISVVAVGNMRENALAAAELSEKSVEVIDLRTVKPFDVDTLAKSIEKTGKMIVLEDNVKIGGAGSQIEAALGRAVIKLGYSDSPILHGSFEELYRQCGVDADSVAQIIKRECDS